MEKIQNIEKLELQNPEEALANLEKNEEKLSIMEGEKIPIVLETATKKDIGNFCFDMNNILNKYGDFSKLLAKKEKNPIGLTKIA